MKDNSNRQYYEALFETYPDVVDTETVRIMLGGVTSKTVLKLIHDGNLKHIFYANHQYLIPKEWLIDYVLGSHYKQYKYSLSAQI